MNIKYIISFIAACGVYVILTTDSNIESSVTNNVTSNIQNNNDEIVVDSKVKVAKNTINDENILEQLDEKFPAIVETEELDRTLEEYVSDTTQNKINRILEVKDAELQKEYVRELFYGLTDEDDGSSILTLLVQSGVDPDLVIGYVDVLSFQSMENAYHIIENDLTNEQKTRYITSYVNSATMNMYDMPESFNSVIQEYEVNPDYSLLYSGIVDFGDDEKYFLNHPNSYKYLENSPENINEWGRVAWYLAVNKVYEDSYILDEINERISHDNNFAWLLTHDKEELLQYYYLNSPEMMN